MSSNARILYVEDNELDAELLQREFRKCRLTTTVNVATTISEALDLYDQRNFDAVLIDWNLPDGEGTEVALHVRKDSRTVPIVFVSGALSDRHVSEAAQFKPKACMNKDFRTNDIIKVIGFD